MANRGYFEVISSPQLTFGYFHKELGLVGTLKMSPFKQGEVKNLLKGNGFKVLGVGCLYS